jgi:hypothetical protein
MPNDCYAKIFDIRYHCYFFFFIVFSLLNHLLSFGVKTVTGVQLFKITNMAIEDTIAKILLRCHIQTMKMSILLHYAILKQLQLLICPIMLACNSE